MADVSKVTVSGTTYNIKDATARAGVMPFGVTAGGTTAYTVSISGVTLTVGTLITCKFNATNAANATLNVNSLGAVPIYYKGAKITASQITANYTVLLVYETSTLSTGCWTVIWSYGYDSNSNTVPSAYSTTAAATAAKVATATNYTLTANTYVHVLFQYANSVQNKITLNINSTGAKDIYINGTVSSTTNYTLPAGTYIAYYDGTGFQFRTDGKLPASISGDASTVGGHTVAINVPSNAKFTDTTYSDATTSAHGLMTATDKTKLNRFTYDSENHEIKVTDMIICENTDNSTIVSPTYVNIVGREGVSDDEILQMYITDGDIKIIRNNVIEFSLSSLNTQVQGMLSKIYPVGCIYHSTSSTNPGNASVFGFGTWVEIKITATWDTLKNGTTSYTDGATTGTVHTFRRTA